MNELKSTVVSKDPGGASLIGGQAVSRQSEFGLGIEKAVFQKQLAPPVGGGSKSYVLPEWLDESRGPWGYAEFLEALKDPEHERHAEMIDWLGVQFDPAAVDVD